MVGHVLDALGDQDRLPDRILLTGLDPEGDEAQEALAHPVLAAGVPVEVRPPLPAERGADPPLPDVVADALAAEQEPGAWVWLLQDDSFPEPGALAELLDAASASSGVGIVGPKLVELDDPRRLLSFGQAVSRSGRPAGSGARGQLDQGQFDERRDVLGAPVAGMLVRADVLGDVGGFDPAFGDGVEGLDLCWRSHLAGHRVVLAPRAFVRQGEAGLGLGSPLATRRRTRQLAVARGSFWWGPVRSLGILLTSLLAAVVLLLLKRPRAAAAELADVGAVLAPWRGLGARWRFRGRRRVRRRDLRGLFASSSGAWDGTSDLVQDVLTPRAATGRAGAGAVETGPVSDEAESLGDQGRRSWWSWPLVTTLLLATLTATVRWREQWAGLSGSGNGVSGGQLRGVDADATALWHSWWDGWHGAGLGHAAPPEPWLLPMAGLTWLVERLPWVDPGGSPAAVATAWLLFAAVPASAATAYLAARAVTSSRWTRAAAGLVWAVLPPLGAAVAEGRVGPAVVHVLAPFVVAGVVVAAGRGDGARRTAATFGTILAVAVIAVFVPAVLVPSTLAGLLVLVLGPGWGRLRGLALMTLPWVLLGPWLRAAWEDPRLILGGAGATVPGQEAVEPWQALLLHPAGAVTPWLWWTAPLVVLALLGTLRTGPRGHRAGLLLGTGLLALGAALAAPHVVAGQVPAGYGGEGAPVTAWSGSFLSLAAAGLVLGAVAATDRWGAGPGSAWRRPAVAVVAAVALVAALGLGAWASWNGLGTSLTAAGPGRPAVVTEQAAGAEASRLLELVPAGGILDYRLVGDEPDGWLRDHVRELSAATAPAPGAGADHLAVTVRLLAGHQDVPGTGEGAAEAQARLHELAVGYVALHAHEGDPLAERLDAVPGLTRLGGGGSDVVLWRVAAMGQDEDALVVPSRIRVLDGADRPVAPVLTDGPHATVSGFPLGEVPDGAVLAVSEGAGWTEHASVTVDGEPLRATGTTWPPTYELPAGGDLDISVRPPDRTWHLVTGGIAIVVAFLALPLGGGRRRSDR